MHARRILSLLVALTLLVLLAPVAPARAAQFVILNGDVAGLRSAIVAANATPAGDEIVLAAGGAYTLTDAYAGDNGLPVITSDITITGNGATIERSSAAGTPSFRIFEVAPIGTLRLTNVTLRNGQVQGTTGAPNPSGPGGAGGDGRGGAVYNTGVLTVTGSTLTGNRAIGGPGAPGTVDLVTFITYPRACYALGGAPAVGFSVKEEHPDGHRCPPTVPE